MDSEQDMDAPQLYVVRVWHGGTGFRASVRSPDEDAPRWFVAPAALASYLAHAPAAPPPDRPPTRGGTDDEPPRR